MTRLLILSGLLCAAPLASAQTATDGSAADASTSATQSQHQAHGGLADANVIASIALRLGDSAPEVRAEALQEASHHSMFSQDLKSLDILVSPLLTVMREDANASHRLMAALTLTRIGDASTLRTVARIGASDPDPQVRRSVRIARQSAARSSRS